MSTDLATIEYRPVGLFSGAVQERIEAAADVATRFNDIVKQKRMYRRIGQNDHILIEAWQTIGSLTGVYANEAGGVTELPWPPISPAGEEPILGPEPRTKNNETYREWEKTKELWDRWKHFEDMHAARALGRAFGFKVSYVATKDGQPMGWGEGRCTRSEVARVNQDDSQLSSMAQTRAQSRALGAPLKWIVKLAGYEPTTPDEDPQAPAMVSGADEIARLEHELLNAREALKSADLHKDHGKWGATADQQLVDQALVALVEILDGEEEDALKFMATLSKKLDGVPEGVARTLKLLAWYQQHPPESRSGKKAKEAATAAAESTTNEGNSPDESA